MKTRLNQLTATLLILGLGINGCVAPATQPPRTQTPVPEAPTAQPPQPPPTETSVVQATPTANLPSATVMGVVERTNAGDVEGALAYFADDATLYLVGLPPTGIESYHGKEQILSFWEDNVSNHLQWEAEISSVVGNVVTARVKTWHDFTRELGVAPLEWLDVYEVKDGIITTYSGTITEEALAKLRPALAEVMPPEPPAAPSSETPISELTVSISGGTCTYDGPMTLQAGEIQVTMDVQDQDNENYALTFFTLDPDKDVLDLMASTPRADPPGWADMISMHTLGAGKSATYSVTVEEGPVYGICWSQPPDLSIGVVGPFTVNPPSPSSAGPATEMTITISEGACTYDGPMTLQAGEMTVTADVKDVDKEEYLLTFINLLDPAKTFADLMAATSGDAPPDWADVISEKHLSPGESQTYSFTLEAGPVYLICWSTPPERTIGKKGPFEVMP